MFQQAALAYFIEAEAVLFKEPKDLNIIAICITEHMMAMLQHTCQTTLSAQKILNNNCGCVTYNNIYKRHRQPITFTELRLIYSDI
jgi:hypothetical protein